MVTLFKCIYSIAHYTRSVGDLRLKPLTLSVLVILSFSYPVSSPGADHADPMMAGAPVEAGLTGLFAWHESRGSERDLVMVLNTHRGLDQAGPYNLDPYQFIIYIDDNANINLFNPEKTARYGGEVVEPESIRPRIRVSFRLNNSAGLEGFVVHARKSRGGEWEEVTENKEYAWSGVRDDPFTFPRFYWTNVIAMVVRIPLDILPLESHKLVIWGESQEKDGDKIDHVGIANRTQLARLDFLNELAPSEQAMALQRRYDKGETLDDMLQVTPALSGLFNYVLKVRPYDLVPDVMILDLDRPAGFPNGRQLHDDVAARTCDVGDCILQEFSYIDSSSWPRHVGTNRAFLKDSPYLGVPWPSRGGPPPMPPYRWWMTIEFVTAFVLLVGLLLFLWLYPVRKPEASDHGGSST